jgi:hypothetical protein
MGDEQEAKHAHKLHFARIQTSLLAHDQKATKTRARDEQRSFGCNTRA